MYLTRVLGLVIVAALLLGGCAAGQPKDPNNICYILKENKGWYKDAKKARKRLGLPVHVGFAFVHRESTFVADAKPPRKRVLGVPLGRTSSAYGYAQATDEAWTDYKKATGRRFVKRTNFGDALDFIGWYNDRSNKRLRLRKNDTYNLYLAYYNGHSGYAKGAWKKSSTIKGYAKKASRQAAIYAKQLRRCT
jgi:hypothetical protein